MACPALSSAAGLILGTSPRYRRTLPPVANTLSPSTNVLNVATPISVASACMRSWCGPTKQPPMSTGTPSRLVCVQTGPRAIPRLEHHHRAPGPGEPAGRRQAGQARADDTHVCFPGRARGGGGHVRPPCEWTVTCVLPACKCPEEMPR